MLVVSSRLALSRRPLFPLWLSCVGCWMPLLDSRNPKRTGYAMVSRCGVKRASG